MNPEQFRQTLHQEPFRPFTIHMVDGRTIDVAHRDLVAISPLGQTVIVFQVKDSFTVLDMGQMAALTV